MTQTQVTQTQIQAQTLAHQFPQGFRWGVATAAYQIEGAAHEDGRGPSIWDIFSRTPGRVYGGHTGDVACDHYHRFRDDVALMSQLGVGTYRFSVAWPRIRPDGSGPVNPRGMDFYDRLVDALLEAGIAPMLTLYHWDLPQALEDLGGWSNRDTAYHFADYATALFSRLGDRVPTWTTLNEPWCSAFLGYASGDHAPGDKDPARAFRAVHHLLLAHGLAARELRNLGAQEISLTTILSHVSPRDPQDRHDAAAAKLVDGLHNRIFLDPLLRGAYPADILEHIARFTSLNHIAPADLEIIAAPLDFLGVNYYQPTLVGAQVATPSSPQFPGTEGIAFLPQDVPTTGMGWPIDADGLRKTLLRVAEDYPGVPVIITENGASFPDTVQTGRVNDVERISYISDHLAAVHDALSAGVDMRGYMAWSLMDNFEWAYGYDKRFGLIHVDYATQQRLLKESALWFRQVIADNGF